MSSEVLYERDMLYPTENLNEPGSVHLQIFSPNKKARIPAVIESKTSHSPTKYIDSIIRIMQSDIFDRIFVDMKKNVDIFIKTGPELAAKYDDKPYIKAIYSGDKVEYQGTDIIE